MTEIRFYHLQKTPLDYALPMILEKSLSVGHRVIVRVPDAEAKAHFDEWLWTYKAEGFLPHGVAESEDAALHPIVITDQDDMNPNDAKMLVLTHGCTSEKLDEFDLCCEMLNGAVEDQITAARARWKDYKEKGYTISYWAQDDQGKWSKKA